MTKFLSHLQSQDFSFLQQQINEQHLLGEFYEDEDPNLIPENPSLFTNKRDMLQKEQRSTLIDFTNNDDENLNNNHHLSHTSSLLSSNSIAKIVAAEQQPIKAHLDFYEHNNKQQ